MSYENTLKNVVPIVLCGGSGTRMWPTSRAQYPKQFIALTGTESLLKRTVNRLGFVEESAILVCHQEHRFLVAEQLRSMNCHPAQILLEPLQKNTTAAIALAALQAVKEGNDPVLLVLPSDHAIENQACFEHSVCDAVSLAEQGILITFGVKPRGPDTAYGYIEPGTSINETSYVIDRFVEKPDQDTAKEFLRSGNYLWNSGMFMFTASAFLHELEMHQPEVYELCLEVSKKQTVEGTFVYFDEDTFQQCPALPVDVAILEKTCRSAVVPMDAGWTDLGSWNSLWEVSEKDSDDNVLLGDSMALDSCDNFVRSDNRLVALVGVQNLVIIETSDAILVADREQLDGIKKITETLKNQQRPEYSQHREVHRPWGRFNSIDHGERYQVKHITVRPGERLSLQMHHHRAEHWVVVSGTANVTCGNVNQLVSENESMYIPIGETHCLENPGKVPLELIEVQSGAYLGEDDIVRFEDCYNRV